MSYLRPIVINNTWQLSLVEQEQFIFPEYLSSSTAFSALCVVFCRQLSVLFSTFLLAMHGLSFDL
jgi:hypothetical protein